MRKKSQRNLYLVAIVSCILLVPWSNAIAETMPPLPKEGRAIYEYYQLEFLDDGYPGKRVGNHVVPHPLYGAYVITDYLRLHREGDDPRYLEAAIHVGDAALARMERFGDALVFWYEPGVGVSRYDKRFYSALTQARYLKAFALLYKASGDDRFRRASEQVLESLYVPAERGGVLVRSDGGAALMEFPIEPHGFILNGWLTSIKLVGEYAQLMDSQCARRLVELNAASLEKLLDVYDMPGLANTRYQLRGYVWFRLVFPDGFDGTIRDLSIHVPNAGDFDVEYAGRVGRWHNFYLNEGVKPQGGAFEVTRDVVQFNAVLSMISYPEVNAIRVKVDAPRAGEVKLLIGSGEYDPLSTGMRTERWIELGKARLKKGDNDLELDIPWEKARLVAYPTNFKKDINGKHYNSYHFLHIHALRELYDSTGNAVFRTYADRWCGYVDRWPKMPQYAGTDIVLKPIPGTDPECSQQH